MTENDQSGAATIDVQTVNKLIEIADEEVLKYPADSPESIALMKLIERYSSL